MSENVRIENVGETSFWVVSGLTGTGGMSVEDEIIDDIHIETETLPQTGTNIMFAWSLLLPLIFVVSKLKHYFN